MGAPEAAILLRLLPALLILSAAAGAAPYVPHHETLVLERIASAGAARQLEPLRAAVARDPEDLAPALQLAREYLQIGRRTADPRFVSYARAALAPWLQRSDAPASVLVLEATALQSLHRFDDALKRLDRALALEPRNAQAQLTKAGLLQVRGEFAQARAACRALSGSADRLVAATCFASVDGMSGRLQASYTLLARLAAQGAPSEALNGWVQGQLGEMAIRLGELAAAREHLRAAMRSTPDDPYLLAVFADLLLLQNEPGEVLELLRTHEAQDALLLRLAIAGRRLGAPGAARWTAVLEARRRAARADDNPHLREHARFALDVLAQPDAALELARSNWAVQREPADIALYARAARAAGSAVDERAVLEWIRAVGYEDRTLEELAPTLTLPRLAGEGTLDRSAGPKFPSPVERRRVREGAERKTEGAARKTEGAAGKTERAAGKIEGAASMAQREVRL
jgi:tetratricopeptide (TPR) repeat protein